MSKKRAKVDDDALKRGYLEMYAGRNAEQSLTRIRGKLGIQLATLDSWMQDDTFCAEIAAIDERRLRAAEGLATTIWPKIVEEQAQIAACVIPPPPPMPQPPDDSADKQEWAEWNYQRRLTEMAYETSVRKRIAMSTRAAELIARYLHQIRPASEGAGFVVSDLVGRMPDNPDEMAQELVRRSDILKRAEKRAEEIRKERENDAEA